MRFDLTPWPPLRFVTALKCRAIHKYAAVVTLSNSVKLTPHTNPLPLIGTEIRSNLSVFGIVRHFSAVIRFLRWISLIFLFLVAGCATSATATPIATLTPPPTATDAPRPTITSTRTPLPTLTPDSGKAPSIPASASPSPTIGAAISAASTVSAAPSATSALLVVASPNIDATLHATFVPTVSAVPPPLTLKLPDGWKSTYTVILPRDQLSEQLMNVAAYAGPVADKGTGFIFIFWNFPSITPLNPGATPLSAEELSRQMILSDGFRLLRGTVVDISCQVGVYADVFKLGGTPVTGQRFQTVGCQDGTPDNAGWYVGAFPNNRELLIYAYVEPVSAYNSGRADLQHILDTVQFSVSAATPATSVIGTSAAPTNAPTLSPPTASSTTTPALY